MWKFFRKKQQAAEPPAEKPSLMFEAQWGGFYAYRDDKGGWSMFRLLDFNKDSVHCTLYNLSFDHQPTLEQAVAAKPAILHAPLDAASLFRYKELALIGGKPLELKDVEGYVHFMHETGKSKERITQVIKNVGAFTRQGAVRFKLTLENDGSNVMAEQA